MLSHTIISEALPAPACDEGLGNHCPAKFETIASSCRPGETDAVVRCRDCGAQRHFVLDTSGNVIHDSGAPESSKLAEYREESSPHAPPAQSLPPSPLDSAPPAEAPSREVEEH